MLKLTLYTTDGCHLCEHAEAMLERLSQSEPELSWTIVDIASSDELMDRYGIRIPVIQLEVADYDLGWPFSDADVVHYLAQFTSPAPL